ncbi:MAG TPA: DUF2203 domain-containing protein [Candidatus Saccharimonadales bacterium]|nr:DUF2203 domain-containing protein [Candidatus Saccharimonadales bacterium]
MPGHFSKHYTLEEARALLPLIRQWLDKLSQHQQRLSVLDKRVNSLIAEGDDAGGPSVNQLVKTLAECKEILQQFSVREIQIKDLSRGLIDFPSFRDGQEIFLCWEKDEDDIEYWHDLDSGYAGRERL